MLKILRNICFVILIPVTLQATAGEGTDYREILSGLESELKQGKKRALRDIGSLLGIAEVDQEARELILKSTLFLPTEVDLTHNISRQAFLDFYYDNENRIHYSDMFDAFFITPIETWPDRKFSLKTRKIQKLDKSFQLRQLIRGLKQRLVAKQWTVCMELVQTIAALNTHEGYEALLKLIQEPTLPLAGKEALDKKICQLLANYPTENTLMVVLQKLADGAISPEFASPILSKITNIFLEDPNKEGDLPQRYAFFLDSLGSIEAMRVYGYQQLYKFDMSFFESEIDYYGRILTLSHNLPWIVHNATKDLLSLNNPKALYYIAAFIFKNRNLTSDFRAIDLEEMKRLLHSITNIDFTFDDKIHENVFKNQSELLNLLMYWTQHYVDYEWNEDQDIFINKEMIAEQAEYYERLFRRLKSRNDTVAFQSFQLLTEGNPSEILELSEKYRQLLRSHNKSIPPLKHRYLEQLTLLTDFCRKNNLQYQPSSQLQNLLYQLLRAEDEIIRYQIENNVIDMLSLEEAVAFEYWAFLHGTDLNLSFSAGRILDWFYARHWRVLVNNDDYLRYYLKKAQLFGEIGVYGVCNSYLNKFQFDIPSPSFQDRLQQLLATESDMGIRNQIEQLLVNEQKQGNVVADFSIDDFLDAPEFVSRKELKILPPPAQNDYPKIISAIQSNDESSSIRKFFEYLSFHPDKRMVPHLFQLIDDSRILVNDNDFVMSVADRVVPIIEDIYQYKFPLAEDQSFSTAQWKKLWKEQGNGYENWGKTFFKEQVAVLNTLPEISIKDINALTESKNYDPAQKSIILQALSKVTPQKDIRRLHISPKLSMEEDFVFFEDFQFDPKELDDIPKFFEITDPNKMLDFIVPRAMQFELSEKGSFYNNLMQNEWIEKSIRENTISPKHAEEIRESLETYLQESDFISEFEEQRTVINIASLENINRSLAEKLESSFVLDADQSSKAKLQEAIISQISYDEIGVVLKYLDMLSMNRTYKPQNFLSRDFGIPIFTMNDYNVFKTFQEDYEKMNEPQLYIHYLKKFGVDFLDKSGKLDYNKIYLILQFDNVSPFLGNGGGKRDWYTFGIIKILENEFKTKLGFKPEINETSMYASHSTSKRSEAWRNYLVEHKLIDLQKNYCPSFNQF